MKPYRRWVEENTRIVKFNGGAGAILCNGCRVIVKEHLTKDDIEGTTPVFCLKCECEGPSTNGKSSRSQRENSGSNPLGSTEGK